MVMVFFVHSKDGINMKKINCYSKIASLVFLIMFFLSIIIGILPFILFKEDDNKYQNLFYYYNTWGSRQNGTCEDEANLRNYHIRLMASSDKYTLGRPRIDENGYTASDEENAKLVSPSFVIASRLGAIYSTSGGLNGLDLDEKLIVFADHAKTYVEVDDIDDKKNQATVS